MTDSPNRLWNLLPSWATPKRDSLTKKEAKRSHSIGLMEKPKRLLTRSNSTLNLSEQSDLFDRSYLPRQTFQRMDTPPRTTATKESLNLCFEDGESVESITDGGSKFLMEEQQAKVFSLDDSIAHIDINGAMEEQLEDINVNQGHLRGKTEESVDDPLPTKTYATVGQVLLGVSENKHSLLNVDDSSTTIEPNESPFEMQSQAVAAEPNYRDPVIPADWMMSFDSPHKPRKTVDRSDRLIDVDQDYQAPKSILKYTQRDLENKLNAQREQFEKEFQLAQTEISELIAKLQKVESENKKMKGTLFDWEKAIQTMITDRERERADVDAQMQQISKIHESINQERNQLLLENNQAKAKIETLILENSNLKKLFENHLTEKQSLDQEIVDLKQKFMQLKQHAQDKLQEANKEIQALITKNETDISGWKLKLKRLEMENASLERSLQGKILENKELMAICDNLEQLCAK